MTARLDYGAPPAEPAHRGRRRYAHVPQFELYTALRERGIDVEAEKWIELAEGAPGRLRADLALYRRGRLWLLIECKSTARELGARQRAKYEAAPVPYLVVGHESIEAALRWIDHQYDAGVLAS